MAAAPSSTTRRRRLVSELPYSTPPQPWFLVCQVLYNAKYTMASRRSSVFICLDDGCRRAGRQDQNSTSLVSGKLGEPPPELSPPQLQKPPNQPLHTGSVGRRDPPGRAYRPLPHHSTLVRTGFEPVSAMQFSLPALPHSPERQSRIGEMDEHVVDHGVACLGLPQHFLNRQLILAEEVQS